ncbi:AprI/Inh family metalloprotease inhibitor [Microvirga pakistanensis]|uniref:AprI/Inh family metalloprotease inhibitor n=1 Tax=Microvirga pakistanensis TaxID=1682650 RepID=UPI00106C5660|nr:AprI/Inh family metalloprotease inhibitor [Microvirga pakistanensis]
MTRRAFALTATLCAALSLGACSSARLGGPAMGSASAAPAAPAPIEAVPSGPVESAPLAPIEGQPLPPIGGAPAPLGSELTPPPGTDVAGLPPAAAPAPIAPAAPASRTAMIGNWTVREASGKSCRIQLSSSPALDLYRASASGCSNQDLSRVNAWDYRDGEVYLYQTGGAVAARLRGSSSSLAGVLAKSGAPLSLAR